MTKRNVMIRMLTARTGVHYSFFSENDAAKEEDEEELEIRPLSLSELGEPEESELLMEGRLITSPQRVELVYEESELTGMEGSVTTVGFDRDQPELISLLRSGGVSSALIFEQGKRHLCLYNTPFSTFEICVYALQVENKLLSEGYIKLDYLIEIHGAQAERCRMTISIKNDEDME